MSQESEFLQWNKSDASSRTWGRQNSDFVNKYGRQSVKGESHFILFISHQKKFLKKLVASLVPDLVFISTANFLVYDPINNQFFLLDPDINRILLKLHLTLQLSQYILSSGTGAAVGLGEDGADRYENVHGDRYEDISSTDQVQ